MVKRSTNDVLIAKLTGIVNLDGERYPIRAGITRVRAGHALARAHPELFDPADVGIHYDVEQATAAPGEARAAAGDGT